MQAIHDAEKYRPKDFDFIALSLAQMNSQGRKVDVEQVTGSMSNACKSRFLDSYRYHLNLFAEKSPS
ncbi:TPA: glycogen synthesis protein GlgS [Raoultella ornithinolytica]|nr:glycogen synthesis protein GlgS [Raoultella ornithinolytica]HAT1615711.1 glycogen synthesis protein GlgS [Raoultella ornithinolytica]